MTPPGGGRLGETVHDELALLLGASDVLRERLYPGDTGTRQPVHTVYVPADQVEAGLVQSWGARALHALETHAPDPAALAAATGADRALVMEVHSRLLAKLSAEPVEDLRADFEDGYGTRSDDEEDAHAREVGRLLGGEVGGSVARGVRVKSLEPGTRRRGVRTLDLVLEAALDAGPLPDGWVVTLPKVTVVEQVRAMALLCEQLEQAYGLAAGRLRFEIQVETPQAVLGQDGTATVARMVHAANGRCCGLHYGTYDYSAALGVAAPFQRSDHPVADHAKAVMLVAAAGTGVRVSDGSSNVLPVGEPDVVRAAWRLHARLVRRSLEAGIYQGWDLHPAQLPTRFLTTFIFFREAFPAAAARLRDYLDRRQRGTLDEPATALALASMITRGLDCGAVDESEVRGLAGLDRPALDGLARRRTV